MDDAGVDVQVLSVPNAGIQKLGAERATAISRELNDRMAAAVTARPDRLRTFASLPMCDAEAAAEELTRTVRDLGFVGALIAGQTNGVFLDDASMHPVLGAAEGLGVPIYLHPAPPPAVFDAYFSGLEPAVAARLSTSGWGWHADTGPTTSLADTIHEHLWVTTCGYTTDRPLLCTLGVLGADRIMFSVDYPFSDSAEATRFLRDAPLSPADVEKIAHGNAERLLGV